MNRLNKIGKKQLKVSTRMFWTLNKKGRTGKSGNNRKIEGKKSKKTDNKIHRKSKRRNMNQSNTALV